MKLATSVSSALVYYRYKNHSLACLSYTWVIYQYGTCWTLSNLPEEGIIKYI